MLTFFTNLSHFHFFPVPVSALEIVFNTFLSFYF